MSKQEEIKQALELLHKGGAVPLNVVEAVNDLLAQTEEYGTLIEQQGKEMIRLQQLVNKQGKELEEARKVIGWYGDNGNYVQVLGLGGDPTRGYFCMPMVLTDHGERARLY
ncbi:hypothetical protein, partial [Bacillus altitudinis]|uniref:hypothetical protein n=1 Tax=Bacillus altitudinis TaxID=293387 RepID=UPI0036725747